ncbi:MAG: M20 family metallopeptidase [Lentisphaeria bacterium]|nr:M20 family metallopeptidase [Lentisphaeria bacterium]
MEKDVFIDLLCELIRMRPESADIPAVNRVQRRIKAFLDERKLFTVLEKCGEREVLFAATQPGKVQDILLCAHVDVVPADDPSQYEPVIRDGIIYGRGSDDCLGNAVAAVKAMCTAPAGSSVGCIFTGDEEIGGHTTAFMVEQGYSARRLGLILDASGGIYNCQKGILNLKLTARGKGGHASRPWALDNPVVKLVEGLHKLIGGWSNPTGLDDWRPSIAPTVLRAGSVVNRIPDEAEARLNIRLTKTEEKEQIIDFVRKTTGLEVAVAGSCDPFDTPADTPEMKKLLAAYAKVFGAADPGPKRMAGATDARHLCKIGVPVGVSGTTGSGAHGREEHLDLASVDQVVRLVHEVL